MAMNTYDVGDVVRMTGTFRVGSTLTSPTAITFEIVDPSENKTTLAIGDLTNPSTGIYYYDVAIDEEGIWTYRYAGTATVICAGESNFFIRYQQVT